AAPLGLVLALPLARAFLRLDAIAFLQPAAEIDVGAALGAERAVFLVRRPGAADRALGPGTHGAQRRRGTVSGLVHRSPSAPLRSSASSWEASGAPRRVRVSSNRPSRVKP